MTSLQTPVEFLNVSAAVSGMTAAEQREYETGLASPTEIVNRDGAGLTIEWDILRTRSSKTDEGEVKVYNLAQAFRGGLHAEWLRRTARGVGFKVGVHVGWGGDLNLIMAGDAWEIVPDMRRGQEVITLFRFGEGQRAIVESTPDAPKQYLYESGNALGLWLVIQDLFMQLGQLRIDPAMQAPFMAAVQRTPIAASGSWVLDGELTRVIGDLLDTFGLEWKVINGQVIFLERGITASSQGQAAALLAPSTGLLEWSPTDAGLALTALAQPSIRPGSQIVVRDGFGRPVGAPGFRVESVRFTGSTFTGESIMTIEARRSVPL